METAARNSRCGANAADGQALIAIGRGELEGSSVKECAVARTHLDSIQECPLLARGGRRCKLSFGHIATEATVQLVELVRGDVPERQQPIREAVHHGGG